jgi:hypothetical protein
LNRIEIVTSSGRVAREALEVNASDLVLVPIPHGDSCLVCDGVQTVAEKATRMAMGV